MKKLSFLLLISIHFDSFSQYSQDSITSCCEAYSSIIRKAEQKYEQGNLIRAIEIYEKALYFRPSDQKVICRLEELNLEKASLLKIPLIKI